MRGRLGRRSDTDGVGRGVLGRRPLGGGATATAAGPVAPTGAGRAGNGARGRPSCLTPRSASLPRSPRRIRAPPPMESRSGTRSSGTQKSSGSGGGGNAPAPPRSTPDEPKRATAAPVSTPRTTWTAQRNSVAPIQRDADTRRTQRRTRTPYTIGGTAWATHQGRGRLGQAPATTRASTSAP